jgi:hypothetical protein
MVFAFLNVPGRVELTDEEIIELLTDEIITLSNSDIFHPSHQLNTRQVTSPALDTLSLIPNTKALSPPAHSSAAYFAVLEITSITELCVCVCSPVTTARGYTQQNDQQMTLACGLVVANPRVPTLLT